MERTSLRLQELIQLHLQQTIAHQELVELLEYAKDPLFEHEIKEKLSLLFEEIEPKALGEEEQNAILKNIFKRKPK